MSITLFGTCRLNGICNNNNLNNMINYCHSTKEVIQFIKFLKGELPITSPYTMLCFRTGICNKKHIEYNSMYSKLYYNTNIFVIEICSNKLYKHNGYYLHHLCVDKRFERHNDVTSQNIFDEYVVEKQNSQEIENDILEIKNMIYPKKMIIVSHYNSLMDGKVIPSRNGLIHLLTQICEKHNIHFVNPTLALSEFSQEQVMTNDLGHYTDFGLSAFSKYMNAYIRNNL